MLASALNLHKILTEILLLGEGFSDETSLFSQTNYGVFKTLRFVLYLLLV